MITEPLKATVIGIEWDLIPRSATVQCDVCYDQYQAGSKFMPPWERVKLAEDLRAAGWLVEGDHARHLCPDCKRYAEYWAQMTPEEKAEEVRMIDEHSAQSDGY